MNTNLSMDSYINDIKKGILPSLIELEMLDETYTNRIKSKFPTTDKSVIKDYLKERTILDIVQKLKHIVINYNSPIIDFIQEDCNMIIIACNDYYNKLMSSDKITNDSVHDFSYFLLYDNVNTSIKYADMLIGVLPRYKYSVEQFSNNLENIKKEQIDFVYNSLYKTKGNMVLPSEILREIAINMIMDKVVDVELLNLLDNMCINYIKIYLYELKLMVKRESERPDILAVNKNSTIKTALYTYEFTLMFFAFLFILIAVIFEFVM